jgi:dynein intermediate chain 1
MKDKLESEELMALKLISDGATAAAGGQGEEEDTGLSGLAGGLCFDFHKENQDLFLIGTEEGRIHKCSKSFSGQYLDTYEGHSMAVYTVRWNEFHPNIFISSSADWTVKLWDHTVKSCVMSFDLAQQVGDVAWSPYSSTVFAAITSDGLVHCYDLHVNRNERVCCQKVVKKAKLTHVAFNESEPVIIVGDDRGGVNSLKLSPNLRVAQMAGKDPEQQVKNMENLLEMVKDNVE